MSLQSIAPVDARSRGIHARGQRGVVLFIALLVMVALALAGIALIRSADTATIVAGNLAFKQATASAVDLSIERAVADLFGPTADPKVSNPVITDKTVDRPDKNYFASVRLKAGSIPEIPDELLTSTAAKASLTPVSLTADPTTTSYYVIERMCANPGPALSSNCNLSSQGLGADAGTQHYEGLVRPGDAFYRVTVRVEGPRNTVAYAQAILK